MAERAPERGPEEDQPREFTPDAWLNAPPPRRSSGEAESGTGPVLSVPILEVEAAEPGHEEQQDSSRATAESPEPAQEFVSPSPARWTRRLILGSLGMVLLLLGAGAVVVYRIHQGEEERLARKAFEEYENRQYLAAGEKFLGLANAYPSSPDQDHYLLMDKLCGLRYEVKEQGSEAVHKLQQLETFIDGHRDHPRLPEHAADLGATLVQIVDDYAATMEAPTDTTPREFVTVARATLEKVKQVAREAISAEEEKRLDQELTRIERQVDTWEQKERTIQQLVQMEGSPAELLPELCDLLAEAKALYPEVDQDPRIREKLKKLRRQHEQEVVYTDKGFDAQQSRPRPTEGVNLVLDPLVAGNPPRAATNDPVTLALARGVLYGLRKTDGSVRWAMRVGIDSTTLPIRVPRTLANPERILVLSADADTLTALDEAGSRLWEYQLSGPCLGSPVIVDNRALIATYDGQIHEVELAEGRLVGRWVVGQRFTVGGTLDPQTNLAYFPAEHSFVYVLDVKTKQLEAILHSGHPSGSLRGEAVVIPAQELGARVHANAATRTRPGYLILPLASGLDEVELRTFELPIRDREAQPLALDPIPRVPGWTWFKPTQDGERLVMLSDRGFLGLYGIRQLGNQDPALFPLLGSNGLDLKDLLGIQERNSGEFRYGRAQVIHTDGTDLWVLAQGSAQKLQMGWNGVKGRAVIAGWQKPLPLGSPLHISQVEEDPAQGTSSLFVVTQKLNTQTCLATAIDDQTGQPHWQRQLGLIPHGSPVLVYSKNPLLPPTILLQDQEGGLFVLDPARFPMIKRGWLRESRPVRLGDPLAPDDENPPLLLAHPDGHSAFQFVQSAGKKLTLRHIFFTGPGQVSLLERSIPLQARLAGQPALMDSWVVLPLDDGVLYRARLPVAGELKVGEPEIGPDWRARRGFPNSPGHALALGGELLLTTDGNQGLTTWRWPARQDEFPMSLPESREPPTHRVDARIVAPPLLVPGGTSVRVCVADASDTLTLLALTSGGALEELRRWNVGGAIEEPFLRTLPTGERRIGCLVNHQELVWIDPEQEAIAWRYHSLSGDALVGQPRLAAKLLLVADESGRIVGLHPEDGKPVGPGHLFAGSVVATVTPLPFGPGRILVPLSDGTATLLSLDRLGAPETPPPPNRKVEP